MIGGMVNTRHEPVVTLTTHTPQGGARDIEMETGGQVNMQ